MISSCPEGKICNVNRMYSTSALNFANNPGYCVDNDYVGEDRLPGEYCSGNDECRSKNC